jgi:hypothetical protein
MPRVRLVLTLAIAGCHGDSNDTADAAVAPHMDAADNCGAAAIYVTGEYLDWDSSATAFKGIGDATLTVQDEPTKTTRTETSGRFQLCPANDTQNLVTVEPKPPYIGGTIVVLKEVTGSNGNFRLRSYTKDRGQMGASPFDPTKAQLFVHVVGAERAIDVPAKHDSAIHFTGTAWAAGDTGIDVYLPNVDPTGGSTKLAVTNATPVGLIPLTPGQFTYVVIVAH